MLTDCQQSQAFLQQVVVRQSLVQAQRFADLAADRQHRIEAGHRLLEDHGDAIAADLLQLALARLQQVAAAQQHAAAGNVPRRIGDQPQQRQGRGALAAAALANEGEDLALVQVEGDAIDGRDQSVVCQEFDGEVAHAEQRQGGPATDWSFACNPMPFSRGSRASRNPSPTN